jgi:hypothetical protein
MNSQLDTRQSVPSSGQTLGLQIGSVRCALRCQDISIYKRLQRLYRNFLTEKPVDITIELEGTDRLTPDNTGAVVAKIKFIHKNGNNFNTSSQIIAGLPDLHHSISVTGKKSLAESDHLDFRYLNRLISLAYYTVCQEKYGGNPPAMLAHSCGVLRDGQALVFAGPSEAGKTTVARLCGEHDGEVINDEMLLISRPTSNGNSINVQSVPIIGRFPPQRSVTAPLRCILLLKKSSKTTVRCLERVEAYLRFLRQIITPAYIGQPDVRTVLSLMAAFSDEVTGTTPVYELEFTLDGEPLWQVIAELESSLAKKEWR